MAEDVCLELGSPWDRLVIRLTGHVNVQNDTTKRPSGLFECELDIQALQELKDSYREVC